MEGFLFSDDLVSFSSYLSSPSKPHDIQSHSIRRYKFNHPTRRGEIYEPAI